MGFVLFCSIARNIKREKFATVPSQERAGNRRRNIVQVKRVIRGLLSLYGEVAGQDVKEAVVYIQPRKGLDCR